MGQRFQSVIILPPIYMNKNNPNNRDKKVLIFYTQWLYGFSAIKINLNIMKRLKQAINQRNKILCFEKTKKEFINHHLKNSVLNAINFCALKEVHNEIKFHPPREFIFEDFKQLGEEMSQEDNNNGFFICEIDKDLNLSYAFISGLEDTENNKIVNPKEYLNLFYKDDKIKKEWGLKGEKQINKVLNDYLKFDGMLLYPLGDTIKTLNQNKPDWAKPDGLNKILAR